MSARPARPARGCARGASGNGRRSKRRREKPGVGSTRRRSSCPRGAERRPGAGRPATRARSASLGSTPRPWTRPRLWGSSARGTLSTSTRTHGRNRTREAQGPLGSGESGAATWQRCDHLAARNRPRERRVPYNTCGCGWRSTSSSRQPSIGQCAAATGWPSAPWRLGAPVLRAAPGRWEVVRWAPAPVGRRG
jgi:hypothetical protein